MNFNQYRSPQLGDIVNMVRPGRVIEGQNNTDLTPGTVEELKDNSKYSENTTST